MAKKKRVLLFSPPFSGHLAVLKNLIWQYRHQVDFHLVITGWRNIRPDVSGMTIPVTIGAHHDLRETDPAIWTLPRTVDLLEDCLNIAKKEKPDLIIYDFFSLEGFFTGKLLRIPYWSSIPAMMGPFVHRRYLKNKLALEINRDAIRLLQKKYPGMLQLKEMEMISDGLHIAGQKNLVWSYPTLPPHDFMLNRRPAEYVFAGYLEGRPRQKQAHQPPGKRPLVYISFGTVVLDNIWNHQPRLRKKMMTFIRRLADVTKQEAYDVLFVDRGKPLLDIRPTNWRTLDASDQPSVLSRASVFVTHAGGNSFHEAVLKHVPMIAIPFFGDQPLVARRIVELGLGKNMVADDIGIDTKKPKDFLDARLAERVRDAIREEIANHAHYERNFRRLKLTSANLTRMLCG